MRYLESLFVLLVLAAFPATARASKPASQSQKAALSRSFDPGVPARCLTAAISTEDPSFAEVYVTGVWGARQRVPAGCERHAANGVTIFRHHAGRWRVVTAGSSFVTGGRCRVPDVPTPVVEDFGLCGSLEPRAPATMSAPSHARVGSRIAVRAADLEPGDYTLVLAVEESSRGASPTICSARVGSARAREGKAAISGKLPRRLACRTGAGPVLGYTAVRPGSYMLSLGILLPPAGFRGGSFVKRTIRLRD